ncbi:MAG: helix-hairpin-helix domain-containing protein, partial [Bacteroidales bacterium]|nr:helix-hairpin-helix domain-containing protein [Bacteroidales bacterium]
MMKKILPFLIILIYLSDNALCQPEISPQIQGLMEELISETEDDSEISVIYEHLEAVLQNPYEINSVSKEELESLFIITDFQIYTFLEYREKYGRILSLKELYLIIGFNPDIIEQLKAFVVVGNEASSSMPTHSKRYSDFKILNRYVKSTPAKNGFLEEADSLTAFSGNNYSRLFKLQYKFGDNFSTGLTMESDAGEALRFDKYTNGFDFYSAYFQLQRPDKIVNNFIVGDFRLSSGLGLIHGYGFSSKSSESLIKQKFTQIKRFTSTAESGFYRGLAIKSSLLNFESILYFSRNNQSANLKTDENDDVFFSSIDISGLHRNLSEQIHKNSIIEQNSGFILSRINNASRFSYQANLTQFERALQYRKYPDRYSELKNTNKFFNQSVSYNKLLSKFNMSGEFALDKNYNLAIQQIINAYLHPLLSMSLSYRYFSPRYIS